MTSRWYSGLIGPYPFNKFALVENFWETGYGMPSFTLLGPEIIRFPFILHSSFPHEILHNWWGNSVFVDYGTGNWCEGLTAYLADHLVEEQRGKGAEYRRGTLQKYRRLREGGPRLRARRVPLARERRDRGGRVRQGADGLPHAAAGSGRLPLQVLPRRVRDPQVPGAARSMEGRGACGGVGGGREVSLGSSRSGSCGLAHRCRSSLRCRRPWPAAQGYVVRGSISRHRAASRTGRRSARRSDGEGCRVSRRAVEGANASFESRCPAGRSRCTSIPTSTFSARSTPARRHLRLVSCLASRAFWRCCRLARRGFGCAGLPRARGRLAECEPRGRGEGATPSFRASAATRQSGCWGVEPVRECGSTGSRVFDRWDGSTSTARGCRSSITPRS